MMEPARSIEKNKVLIKRDKTVSHLNHLIETLKVCCDSKLDKMMPQT